MDDQVGNIKKKSDKQFLESDNLKIIIDEVVKKSCI
jgi:hypothetical protein